MKIIAHRGAGKLAPENSLLAIRTSRDLGVDGIEFDIRPTLDGKLVLFHDKSLRRLGYSRKNISDLTMEELKQVKLKSGVPICTLEEAITAAKDTRLVIEGKGAGWAKPLSKILQSYPYKNTLRVISFNTDELALFKVLMPGIKLNLCGIGRGMKKLKLANRYGFAGIAIYYLSLNPFIFSFARKHKLEVIIYGANSYHLVKFIHKLHPYSEITTDSPQKFIKLDKEITS